MQSSGEQPLVGEEHCVTTLITAAKETMAEAARGGKAHDLFSDITSTANEIFSRLPEEEFAKLRDQNQNTSKSTKI